MQPPQHELVVEDCNAALNLDKRYVKALNRRAAALEALGRFEDSLSGQWHRCKFRHINSPSSRFHCIHHLGEVCEWVNSGGC